MYSGTQIEVLRLVQENSSKMQKLLNRARSIRSMQGVDDSESTLNAVQSFIRNPFGASIEEELNQSSVYQKARVAAAEELLAGKIELLEEKYKLGKVLALELYFNI